MKSPKSFYGDNFPFGEKFLSFLDRQITSDFLLSVHPGEMFAKLKPDLGATIWASYRLGMKASLGWILILGPASFTHLEAAHSCFRPVVGDVLNDCKPGTAICAIDKWVTKAAVYWIKKLFQTIGANAYVRG